MNILIADDDQVVRCVLQQALGAVSRYSVRLAADGAEAWRSLLDEPADLILSDWLMPELDGLELCSRLREAMGPAPYFLLMSGCDLSDANCDEAFRAGVDDFIMKPFTLRSIQMRVRVAEQALAHPGRFAVSSPLCLPRKRR